MKQEPSIEDLIALGRNVQEYRRRGGASTLKRYGVGYFSNLGKLSAERKKASKDSKSVLPIDN